jgi:hypothetical protein
MYGAATLAIVESSRSIRVAASATAKASQRQRLVVVLTARSSSTSERIILFRIVTTGDGNHIGRMERVLAA